MQEKARVKWNERGGMYGHLCARLCVCVCVYVLEERKREEGWVVTPWKSGDNASALNPPSFRREGRIRAGRGGVWRYGVKEEKAARICPSVRSRVRRAGCSAKFKESMANSAYSAARRVEMKTEREDFSSGAYFWQ